MTTKRYAVIDKTGYVINHILIDDPYPKDYYPGYGAAMLCLDGEPDLSNGTALPVLDLVPDQTPQIGDTINLKTGAVTKFVPVITEAKDEDDNPILDEKGEPVLISSVPVVKFIREVEPTKGEQSPTGKVSSDILTAEVTK